MSDSAPPDPALLLERLERLQRDTERMDQLIEAAERRITQGEQRTALDRAILDRASTHAHRNTETLHGAQGVLVRFAVLERWAHEAAENNKKIRNYAATLLVAVLVKIAWDVLTKLGAN